MRAKAFQELGGALKDARAAATAGKQGRERDELDRIFDGLARTVANVCQRQSPRFDRPRFLEDAGLSR